MLNFILGFLLCVLFCEAMVCVQRHTEVSTLCAVWWMDGVHAMPGVCLWFFLHLTDL